MKAPEGDVADVAPHEHRCEGDEAVARPVDVLLVHLVGEHREGVAAGEVEHHLDVARVEHRAGGVARIDDGDGAHPDALRHRLGVGFLERLPRQAPLPLLVEEVGDLGPAEQRDGRRVERVLRDGDHHTVARPVHEEAQHRLHALAGAVGQEDVLGVGGDPVALLDEVGHRLADEAVPLALGVGAQAVRALAEREEGGRTRVLGERRRRRSGEQLGVFGQRQHLAQEGDGLLAERLGVADVAVDDAPSLVLQLRCASHDGAADRVLGLPDRVADVLEREGHGGPFGSMKGAG